MKSILILNGSITGNLGNTQTLINLVQEKLVKSEVIHLKDFIEKKISLNDLKLKIKNADGFIFTSGTYWDSWGSPLQFFLEAATEFEGSDIFVGKPAGVIITMHAVGGKSVLSRLQGVLNTMGMMIPPMSGMVYSLAQHLALESESTFSEDFWSMEDIDVVIHNVLVSMGNKEYITWPIDNKDPKRIWIK